jgi:class I fructose-bisphosphate aldolase
MNKRIQDFINRDSHKLVEHRCKAISKESIHLPGPDLIDHVFVHTDCFISVLNNLAWIRSVGRLGHTGYTSILPVDQGIEHSAAASFAPNPVYFDPENIIKLALEEGWLRWHLCWVF